MREKREGCRISTEERENLWLALISPTRKVDLGVNKLYSMRGVSSWCSLVYFLPEMVYLGSKSFLDLSWCLVFWSILYWFEAINWFTWVSFVFSRCVQVKIVEKWILESKISSLIFQSPLRSTDSGIQMTCHLCFFFKNRQAMHCPPSLIKEKAQTCEPWVANQYTYPCFFFFFFLFFCFLIFFISFFNVGFLFIYYGFFFYQFCSSIFD